MKKLIAVLALTFVLTPCFASDYNYTYNYNQVQTLNDVYKQPCNKQLASSYQYKLEPISVYTGKTVTVQKHYDVYQPVVTYKKVNSYTTTQTCKYCD